MGEPVHEDVSAEGNAHGEEGGIGTHFVVKTADDPVGFMVVGAMVEAGGLI